MKRSVALLVAMVSVAFLQLSKAQAQPETAPASPGVQAPRPMTNQDVLSLIQNKLPEQTIVLAIQSAPATGFDTSPQALIELSKQGVPQAIIDAMINPKKSTAPASAQMMPGMMTPKMPWEAAAEQVPGLPKQMGIYLKADPGFTALRNAPVASGKAKIGVGTFMFGATRTAMRYDGAHAQLQLLNPTPTFYVFMQGWDERTARILRVDVKEDSREVVMKRMRLAVREADTIESDIKVVVSGQFPIFTITPKQPLEPGEYIIFPSEMGGTGYEFGVPETPQANPANS